MAELVYALCAIASTLCAVLLLRGYRRTQARLLFWGSTCFAGLALNNVFLVVDLVFLPAAIDLRPMRASIALVSMTVLVFGLVWDSR